MTGIFTFTAKSGGYQTCRSEMIVKSNSTEKYLLKVNKINTRCEMFSKVTVRILELDQVTSLWCLYSFFINFEYF